MSTDAVEDYLKAIFAIARADTPAGTNAIAARLGVSAGSVSGMVKRLTDRGLVEHEPYRGARLTAAGRAEAIRLVRRHRLIELFLVRVLGFTWDRVHEEAERLEHAVTDELVDRMAELLGHPEVDPHGAPIPHAGRPFREPTWPRLIEAPVGHRLVLRQVADEDPEVLRYLEGLELLPGNELKVLGRAPMRGPLRVEVGGVVRHIGAELASELRVEAVDGSALLSGPASGQRRNRRERTHA
jgi:DtxR family Mn-dependent transcriptional regulator